MTHRPITAESLFEDHFRRFYPPEQRDDLATLIAARARAIELDPEVAAEHARSISEAIHGLAHHAPIVLDRRDLVLDLSDASVHHLGAALDRSARDRLLAEPRRDDEPSTLFNVVVHGAAYVGACVVERHGGVWGVRRPLWESVVRLRSRAGEGDLAVFHWWLKSLSDDGGDGRGATLADRYRTHVEVPCAR
ncbi:MAG: hypothetical protein ACHREM_31540, partial [Polyangiales bacterium]